jgi:hypothetical protein
MGHTDRAGLPGYGSHWAEDHAEGAFLASRAFTEVSDEAEYREDLEAADEELYEDDLLSLIQNRPSRRRKLS